MNVTDEELIEKTLEIVDDAKKVQGTPAFFLTDEFDVSPKTVSSTLSALARKDFLKVENLKTIPIYSKSEKKSIQDLKMELKSRREARHIPIMEAFLNFIENESDLFGTATRREIFHTLRSKYNFSIGYARFDRIIGELIDEKILEEIPFGAMYLLKRKES